MAKENTVTLKLQHEVISCEQSKPLDQAGVGCRM